MKMAWKWADGKFLTEQDIKDYVNRLPCGCVECEGEDGTFLLESCPPHKAADEFAALCRAALGRKNN